MVTSKGYILSPEAQSSLHQIQVYSMAHFGRNKTKHYLLKIQHRMQSLAENPLQGLLRKELHAGYYSSFIESHTIYYRIKRSHIEIIDVLHQSMEPSRHLDG